MLDTNAEAKASFLAHWESVTVTRSNPTFDGVQPNHDNVVRIRQAAKASASKKSSSSSKPKAPKVSVHVTYHVS